MKKLSRQIVFALFGISLFATAASAGDAPDLKPTAVTVDHAYADPGATVLVACDVVNAGTGASGASRLKYYFSADDKVDAKDTYLNYDAVDALAVGGKNSENANVKIPATAPLGAAYLLVVVDSEGAIAEADETNNVGAVAITVGKPPADNRPDFVLTNATLSAGRVDANKTVTAAVDVFNSGAAADRETQLSYYLSTDRTLSANDVYLNYDKVDALAAGALGHEDASLRVPSGTPDGLYYVLFAADAKSAISEIDETNNVTAVQLLVGNYVPRPDLQVVSATMAATLIQAGQTVAVTAVVKNTGDISEGETKLKYVLSRDKLYDTNDKQLTYDSVDALGVGGESAEDAVLRISTATDAGAWYVLFVADGDGVSTELSETNNVYALPLQVTLDQPTAVLPDLVLDVAKLNKMVTLPGTQLTTIATVRNAGPASAGATRLKYFLSVDDHYDSADTYVNYDNIAVLPAGASSTKSANLSLPSTLAYGDYYILFVVDETKAVAEQYESNNVVAVPIEIGDEVTTPVVAPTDAPDLVIARASVDSTIVRAGERASLRSTVRNSGTQPAIATRVKYYFSRDELYDSGDAYLGYDSVVSLKPGETSDEDVTPTVPATASGTWYVLVVADSLEEVTETDESNNVAAVRIEVAVDNPAANAADLTVSETKISKATVGAGMKIQLDAKVANIGVQPASESRLKLYLSADVQYGDEDKYLDYRQLADIAVSGFENVSASVRIPAETKPGGYYLLIVLDTNKELAERMESNNVVPVAITVGTDSGPNAVFPYTCSSSIWNDGELLGRSTIATFNTLHLGWANTKDLASLACVVSHFDLVGLIEVDNAKGLADLEAMLEQLTGESWSSHLSEHDVGNAYGSEFYGYVWRTAAAQFTGSLGFYTDPGDLIKREPYGANFKMGSFDFSLVLFHLQYGDTLTVRRGEAQQLKNIYDYFQNANGTENDLLIGGDFNLAGNDAAFTLVGYDGVSYITDPEQKTSIGPDSLAGSFDNIFYSKKYTKEKTGSGAHNFTIANYASVRETVSDHIPVWLSVDTTVDDD